LPQDRSQGIQGQLCRSKSSPNWLITLCQTHQISQPNCPKRLPSRGCHSSHAIMEQAASLFTLEAKLPAEAQQRQARVDGGLCDYHPAKAGNDLASSRLEMPNAFDSPQASCHSQSKATIHLPGKGPKLPHPPRAKFVKALSPGQISARQI